MSIIAGRTSFQIEMSAFSFCLRKDTDMYTGTFVLNFAPDEWDTYLCLCTTLEPDPKFPVANGYFNSVCMHSKEETMFYVDQAHDLSGDDVGLGLNFRMTCS